MSLKFKIIVTALAVFLAIVTTLVVRSYFYTESIATRMIENEQIDRSRQVASLIGLWADGKKNAIAAEARRLEAKGAGFNDDAEANTVDYALVADANAFDLVYFAQDSDGNFTTSKPVQLPEDYDPRGRPWYQLGRDRKGVQFTEPYVDAITGALVVSIVSQVNAGGGFAGVLGSDIPLTSIIEKVMNEGAGSAGRPFVTDNTGKILIHDDKESVLKKNVSELDPSLSGVMDRISAEESGIVPCSVDGKDMLLAFSKVPELGWVSYMMVDEDAVFAPVRKQAYSLILISLIPVLIGIALFYVLVNRQLRPIDNLIDRLRHIAEGEADLTKTLDQSRKDELGEVARLFNKFIGRMKNIVESVSQLSHGMAGSISELSATVGKISSGMHSQTDETNSLATAVEEMNQTIGQIAESANETSVQANATINSAQGSKASVMDTVAKMQQIAENVKESSEVISRLGASSAQIGDIINVINDIADQTNLLALNAAIEAARAGEAGRGFAVVADEVRKLAERTQSATKEISDMITMLQNESKNAVVKVESGVGQVEAGTQSADSAGKSIVLIMEQTSVTTDMINQIASAAEEQAATTTEIARNVEKINRIAEENSRELSEVSDFAEQVHKNAEELLSTINQFKIK